MITIRDQCQSFVPHSEEASIEKANIETELREIEDKRESLSGKKNRHKRALLNKRKAELDKRLDELKKEGKEVLMKGSMTHCLHRNVRELRKANLKALMEQKKHWLNQKEEFKNESRRYRRSNSKVLEEIESNLAKIERQLQKNKSLDKVEEKVKKMKRARRCYLCKITLDRWMKCPCKRAYYCSEVCQVISIRF